MTLRRAARVQARAATFRDAGNVPAQAGYGIVRVIFGIANEKSQPCSACVTVSK